MQTCSTSTNPSAQGEALSLTIPTNLPTSNSRSSSFSYGNDDASSTVTAAPFVWKLLQAFYTQFPQYENRNFGVFTESYGGHYGPEFASYFESQNAAIAAGTVSGHKIPLVALGINNGWFDPILQYKAYIDYSFGNPYRPIINSTQRTAYTNRYTANCLPALKQCSSITGADPACMNADNVCYGQIEGPLTTAADFDVYDIRAPSNDPNPPSTYVSYLQDPAVAKAIGAQSKYQECPNAPYNKFAATGDGMSSSSVLGSQGLLTGAVDRWPVVPSYAFGCGQIGGSDADLGRGCGLDLQL